MKRRIRRMVNFLGANLLIFAVYLNFFHKDNHDLPTVDMNKRPAFGDSDQNKGAIRANQGSSMHLIEQAALAEPKPGPSSKF